MKDYKLDIIHDVQKAYRKVLDCMARPGRIRNISEEASGGWLSDKCYPSTFLLALMLLDGEVGFNIVSNYKDEVSKLINRITYSRIISVDKSDYIFILSDTKASDCESAFASAAIGDPVDPQKSATLIIETEGLFEAGSLMLRGPGIKDMTNAGIYGYTGWIKKRSEKNARFPLGIDIILTDMSGSIMCLPRTTALEVIA